MSNVLPSRKIIHRMLVLKRAAATAVVTLACSFAGIANAEYILSSGDVVAISVVGLREMQQTITIDIDGNASFPLIGAIKAAGISVSELQHHVRAQLPGKVFRRRTEDGRESQVALSPDEITVTVAEYRPIYLKGDVARPGAQTFRPSITIRQAIALAGGFDTMRFRSRDPFLESADFRADYNSLLTEFARQQVRIGRLKAQLADESQIDRHGFVEVPIQKSVVAQIEDLEARELTSRNDDHAKEKAHWQQAIKVQDRRIAALADDAEKEDQGARADANDLLDMQDKFKRGLIPMVRLNDSRRFTLLSASQSLQTAAQLALAQRERGEMARNLQRVDDQRRINLLKELQDAEVALANIRSRLQAVGEKLMYAGVVKSQLVSGAGGKPDLRIFRNANNVPQVLDADENTPLMPGDVVEVALRVEDLPDSLRPEKQASERGH